MGNGCFSADSKDSVGGPVGSPDVDPAPVKEKEAAPVRPSSEPEFSSEVVMGDGGVAVVNCGKQAAFSGKSRLINSHGREIAMFKYQSKYYALDNSCYHHGGGLLNGDIEVLDGKACVICPWHGYRITLSEGEGLYWGLDTDLRTKKLKSKGCKQRAHQVIVSEDDELLLKINTVGVVDSDHYQNQMAGAGGNIHSSAPPIRNRRLSRAEPRVNAVLEGKGPVSDSGNAYMFEFSIVQGSLAQGIPGQYVRCVINVGDGVETERSWTIVSRPDTTLFRIIIKRKPGGLVSNFMIDKLEVKDCISVLEFCGEFGFIANPIPTPNADVLLLAAGIGITPMLAMLQLAFDGVGYSVGKITLFYVERTEDDFVFLEPLVNWSETQPNFSLKLYLTSPSPVWKGFQGRIHPSEVTKACPTPQHTYICGPEGFMDTMTEHLLTTYPKELIFKEEFV
eukprot:TRINITY_DN9331_c0_g1_i1.p1 TRINITY_DN9331_c0_g1~~TRINITY_DN9331_c0_g1_i1.p1  ORF type:complete len:450 (+),score=57.09 TRINITY_DN9331_c0_g1_i1:45-1394(+)